MTAFDMSPRERAAGRVRGIVREIAGTAFGGRVVEVPIPGFSVFTDRQLDDPLAGVRSSLFVRNLAEGQMYEHAKAARAAGRSWDEIGAALELPERQYASRAEDTFLWLVEGREPERESGGLPSFRSPTTLWRCSTCAQLVTDHGPFEPHPADNESGHAVGCSRHRVDVETWRAQTGGED